ncbi:MAG: hypothetical protein K6T29_00870 [Peptococcaceae bacterium]|nr:hypothetical protein [Peptococcaceae bacterium]
MTVLAENKIVALDRTLFVEKKNYTREQIEIEASGPYSLAENDQCFLIKNMDCCKPIMVTVKAKKVNF